MEKINSYIEKFLEKIKEPLIRRFIRVGLYLWLLLIILLTIITDVNVKQNKEYIEWDHVALYILEYNDVPDNYVHKSQGVTDDEYHITVFAVYDNTREPVKLPTGYTYTEVYINANKDNIQGNSKERFVFSDDQLFYTDDHYDSFEEVKKSDILGTHRFFLSIMIISVVVPPITIIVLIKKDHLTISIVKDDLSGDWKSLKSVVSTQIDRLKKEKDAIDS